MKIALQLTDRLKYRWPPDYCREFACKAVEKGHEVFMVADETNICVQIQRKGIYDSTKDKATTVVRLCDVFVGPPLALADYAKANGVRTIVLQGASLRGDGVRSTTFCVGCDSEGKLEPRVDCLWSDELCMWEISPNDVLEVICGSADTRKTGEPVPK
jgi:hypothetical protein